MPASPSKLDRRSRRPAAPGRSKPGFRPHRLWDSPGNLPRGEKTRGDSQTAFPLSENVAPVAPLEWGQWTGPCGPPARVTHMLLPPTGDPPPREGLAKYLAAAQADAPWGGDPQAPDRGRFRFSGARSSTFTALPRPSASGGSSTCDGSLQAVCCKTRWPRKSHRRATWRLFLLRRAGPALCGAGPIGTSLPLNAFVAAASLREWWTGRAPSGTLDVTSPRLQRPRVYAPKRRDDRRRRPGSRSSPRRTDARSSRAVPLAMSSPGASREEAPGSPILPLKSQESGRSDTFPGPDK